MLPAAHSADHPLTLALTNTPEICTQALKTKALLDQQGMQASVLLADALDEEVVAAASGLEGGAAASRRMLALTEFQVGDLALFLNWKYPGMVAFHVSVLPAPHHFVRLWVFV